jgi:hypothetical protein
VDEQTMTTRHKDCPACRIEEETGETAPPFAHCWRTPTAEELRESEAWIRQHHPEWLDA